MILAIAIWGFIMTALIFLYGVCKLDNAPKAPNVIAMIICVAMVGWFGLSLGSGIIAVTQDG